MVTWLNHDRVFSAPIPPGVEAAFRGLFGPLGGSPAEGKSAFDLMLSMGAVEL